MLDLVLKTLVSLVVVVSVMIIVLRFFLPRIYQGVPEKNRKINIVGALRLNNQNQLLLLEVYNSIILVGQSQSGWQFLKEFTNSCDECPDREKDYS